MSAARAPAAAQLLGDTPTRDYAHKLRLFNAFAESELRQALGTLELAPGMRVLDAGCGVGCALEWIWDTVKPNGVVFGLDLAAAHVRIAREQAPPHTCVVQADLMRAPLQPGSFDVVWSVNTLNHLRDPATGLRSLMRLLQAGGRVALGQSSLLPDMYFAWDARLERVVGEAVRRYYRERYLLRDEDLTAVRALLGTLRRAGLRDVGVRTFNIERIAPVSLADEAYLLEAIFLGTWGERLRPYLPVQDLEALADLCDPRSRGFALRRSDFHFLQTFTLAVGEVP
ncbi:MAG TPA: methyltransferase domain-containing protein [Polyangiales bacterium]|nr:methyltransferase domain-containing protein [Polyangiales bacterium]